MLTLVEVKRTRSEAKNPPCRRLRDKGGAPALFFLILLVADLFHPVDDLAVLLFLNGNMRHGSGGGGAVPVLLARREPDHITGADLLNQSTFALSPAASRCDDKSLTKRMRVPCGPRTRLKRHTGALNKRWIRRLKQR